MVCSSIFGGDVAVNVFGERVSDVVWGHCYIGLEEVNALQFCDFSLLFFARLSPILPLLGDCTQQHRNKNWDRCSQQLFLLLL